MDLTHKCDTEYQESTFDIHVKQWDEREYLQNILPSHANTESFGSCKSSVFRTLSECPAKIQEDFVPREM